MTTRQALEEERRGYLLRNLEDRVAQVDAALAALPPENTEPAVVDAPVELVKAFATTVTVEALEIERAGYEALGKTDQAAECTRQIALLTGTDGPDPKNEDPVDPVLSDVKGIGPATSKKLTDAGITTLAEFLATDAEKVVEITGAKPDQVTDWRNQAETLTTPKA
jgi:predicted flap endonuclease-1-like 5' DNA nuclease